LKLVSAAATGQGDDEADDYGYGAADDQPHGAISWIPGESARNVGTERMGFVEAEDEQHNAQRQHRQAYDVVHGLCLSISF